MGASLNMGAVDLAALGGAGRTRVKICCIGSSDEAAMAVAAGADLLGLLSVMSGGRGSIPDPDIARLAAATAPGVVSVLLSAEVTAAGLVAHVARCAPAALQIVDAAESDAIPALRAAFPALRIVQVIHVEDEGALAQARAATSWPGAADALLLDSGRPSSPERTLGGTGQTHDWAISARIVAEARVPVFLAGGLRPDNVAAAIRQVRPFGVDLCSGVRTGGALDAAKLSAFMAAVRGAWCSPKFY